MLMFALIAALAVPAALNAQEDGPALLQSALYQRDVHGDLPGAIKLYERILRDHSGDRTVAARALVELAGAYEELGRSEAERTYRRVIDEYPDQREAAARARARLAALAPAVAPAPLAAGIVARQLWSAPAELEPHTLAPDGRSIAFIDWGSVQLDGLRGRADVAVYDLASGRARVVTDRASQRDVDTYIIRAVWSPDGSRLAYTLWDTTWTHHDLYVIGADGAGERLVVNNPQLAGIEPMQWAPGGDFIAAVVQGWDELYRISVISLHDGTTRTVKTVGPHWPTTISVSPDGRYIAYEYLQADSSQEHDVFVLAVDGSAEARIEHPANDERPFWTPDGSRIVFQSSRNGQNGLWSVAMEDGRPAGEPELLRPDLGAAQLIGFTRTGGLAYRVPRQETDVHVAVLDLERGTVTDQAPLTTSFVGRNMRAAWSPDGGRLAFISLRGGGPQREPHLVVRSVATGTEQAHPLPFGLLRESRPVWTEDGSGILIDGGEINGETDAFGRISYRVNIATGDVERMPYLRNAGGMWRFASERQATRLADAGLHLAGQRDFKRLEAGEFAAPPGREVLAVRNGVMRMQAGGTLDDVTALTVGGHMHTWELSPDGSLFALALPSDTTKQVSDVLLVMPVSGGEPREIARVGPDREILIVRWAGDGRSLIYAAGSEDEGDLETWHLPLDGSAPRKLDLPLDWREIEELSFHPDGRRVAYSSRSNAHELWVMDGFPWQGGR